MAVEGHIETETRRGYYVLGLKKRQLTARRPCFEKEEVMYGDSAPSMEPSMSETKHTSHRLFR